MLSKYFTMITETEEFKSYINSLIEELKGKKIIIYGAGEGFVKLNQQYNFAEKMDIVAIADKNFETNNFDNFHGIKAICPKNILNEEYDVILVSNEKPKPIIKYLNNDLCLDDTKIKLIFKESIPDEAVNYIYLENYNFSKTLKKLTKKLKNKSIIIYGAGSFFELIKKYYDISGLNIIGISDKKFKNHDKNEEFLGFKVYSPDEITKINPNYVLVATKFYINIIEDLYYNLLEKTKIKIKPLLKKPLMVLVKEIWK